MSGFDKIRVSAVMRDMERHYLGHEGMEDSPVARWARELRGALKSDASDGSDGKKPSCPGCHDAADATFGGRKVTRAPAEDVSASAYDLLPPEDREAVAWVREHGGLESVKERLDWVVGHCSTKQQLDFDFWLSGRVMHELGFDEDMADRDEVERRLLARLMPEGMEWLLEVWPRWSNGEYCRFGDLWVAPTYGENDPKPLRRLAIFSPEQLKEWGQDEGDDFGYEWGFIRPSDTSYRPRKVEAAHVCADRLPIERDETVYLIDGNGTPLTVVDTPIEGCYQSVVVRLPNGVKTAFDPPRLTHTKPEPPDSWERIERDALNFVEDNAGIPHSQDQMERDIMDLVRRAKALAEKGNRNE